MVGGDIPEGQGSVSELLSECFDLNYELRVAAEVEAEDKEATPQVIPPSDDDAEKNKTS